MSTWRQLAERVQRESGSGDNRDVRDKTPSEVPIGPKVPIVPLDASRALKAWRAGLAQVHSHSVPDGWTLNRWAGLCEDAEFIMDGFGEQAARDGWSTADLWGIWPDKPHYGGLADRLRGSRSLVMAGERACWRSWGRVEQFNRGAYPEGVAPRLKLLWQCY